jgi:hypothetical protein
MASGLPAHRIDVIDAIATSLEVIVVLGTLKILAIRFHQHALAQAYLTLF